MALQVFSLFGVLRLDDSDYKQKMQSARTETRSLGATLQNQGRQLQNFGAGMTAFMAPVGAAFAYAAIQGHTFDRTLTNISAILGITSDETAALRTQLIQIGSGTVAGPQAVANAYYEIVSGVADASTHMAILNAAIDTSEAGQADLTATTSALIGTMNAYGFSAQDATYVSDVFSRTVAMGVLSMNDLASAMPQVTGIAAQFGIGIDELGGGMAYLTAQNISAANAATYMKSMITTLLNPTADLALAIDALGYESGAALLESQGLIGAYQALAAQNGGLDGLITNTEALQGALVLTNDGANAFLTTYNEGIAGATANAGVIQDQTEGWGRLRSALDGVALIAEGTLAPALTSLVDNHIYPAVIAIQDWMLENPELTQQIMMITGALVIAGPIIAGVGTVMTVLGGAITAAGVATPILTGAFALLLSPLGLAAAAIAGIVWLINRPGGLSGSLIEAATNATNLANQLRQIIVLASDDIYNAPRDIYNAATGQTRQVGGGGQNGVDGARADGGDVMAGRSYLVGERGPERFVPRMSGTIIPNDELGNNGGGVQINGPINIYANTESGGRAAARGFMDELRSKGVTING